MVSPISPVNGSELLVVNQDGRMVYVTRPQANTILALAGIKSPPLPSILTERTGTETFRAIQGGNLVEMSLTDLTAYLAATGTPDAVPANRKPDLFSGTERFVIRQGTGLVGADVVQAAYLRGTGGSLGGVNDNTPVTSFLALWRDNFVWNDALNWSDAA